MRFFVLLMAELLSLATHASESVDLTPEQLHNRVEQINTTQNKVMMGGSTVEDVDRLFGHCTDDVTYVHEVYGGTYTREELYGNTVRHLKNGGYTLDQDRYTILRTIPGRNAVAVERRENSGAVHLAVFEFRGSEVSRIVEYWK